MAKQFGSTSNIINTTTSTITSNNLSTAAVVTTSISTTTIVTPSSTSIMMMMSDPHNNTGKSIGGAPWQLCYYCSVQQFKNPQDFVKHLRERHCTREGGSFVCRYGYNGVCASLPLDGVSDRDYESHVQKYHVNVTTIINRKFSGNFGVSGGGGVGGVGSGLGGGINQPEQWSIFSAAQNLPAVLNDPSRGKQTNLFTKKWGDSFVEKQMIPTSNRLVEINYNDFELYMKKIGRRYRRHIRLNQTISDHHHQNQLVKNEIISSPRHHHLNNHQNHQTIISSHHNLNPYSNHELIYDTTSLNDIPQIFLKPNLELNSASTFAQVFPGICINTDQMITMTTTSSSSTTQIAKDYQPSGRLLQEKLSHYLDIVEVQIAKQVSQKSSAFFHAMTSQDTIMEEMNYATKNVKSLRQQLQTIDTKLVKQSLEILAMERKRCNNLEVLRKLKVMAEVHQTQPMIQLLLGTQDYVTAIDLISSTQELLAKELIGIHCFKHLPSQLLEMERLIDKMLTTDFEKFSTSDLNRPLQMVMASAGGGGGGGSDDIDQQSLEEEDKLISIVSGLLRHKNFSFIDAYKEEATVTVTALIKQMVIEVIASGDSEICLTGSGKEAQTLTIGEWIQLLDTATGTLLKLLQRIRIVLDVMIRIVDTSAGVLHHEEQQNEENGAVGQDQFNYITHQNNEYYFLNESDHRKVKQKLKEIMHSICNYCHTRCATLISNQSLEKNIATAEQLEKLQIVVREFSGGCERLSGTQSLPLKAALTAQATRYAQIFHDNRKSKMGCILESEQWKQADVPSEFQLMIDSISRGDFTTTKKSQPIESSTNLTTNHINHQQQGPSTILLVDAEPYAVVGAALMLVQIVSEYCRCALRLPIISVQLSLHIIDLLRTFNSKCCQLVLGAGAIRVAKLSKITSTNLALVSRALQLVIWLLPHIKRHFQKLETITDSSLPNTTNTVEKTTTTKLTGYDLVERDFQSHIKEIENKMLTIVNEIINSQMKMWKARPPVPSQSFRDITWHFVKLHEAISSILPEQQVQQVYRCVHKSFKDKLRELLLKNEIINNGGPQHGVVTAELTFYIETLRTLKAIPIDELAYETMNDIWLK